jgi:hypothetical protein
MALRRLLLFSLYIPERANESPIIYLFSLFFCQYSVKNNNFYPHGCVQLSKIQNRVVNIACSISLASPKVHLHLLMFCSFSFLEYQILTSNAVSVFPNHDVDHDVELCFFFCIYQKLQFYRRMLCWLFSSVFKRRNLSK